MITHVMAIIFIKIINIINNFNATTRYFLGGDEVHIVRVWQSAIHDGGWPGLAIDDNYASRYRDCSCAHTCVGKNDFWVAEMNRLYTLTGVRIQFRTDCCCEYLDVVIFYLLCTISYNSALFGYKIF